MVELNFGCLGSSIMFLANETAAEGRPMLNQLRISHSLLWA